MTTHDAQWYRDEMNQLEKQLTPADRKWFDDLHLYLVLGGMLRDETAVTTQLYTMMTDLLAAEQNGDDATSMFGDDPKQLADSLLKELPRIKKSDFWTILGLIVGIAWLVMLISGGQADDVMTINLLSYLGVGGLSMVMIGGVFWAIHYQIYATVKLLQSKVAGFLVLWVILCLYIGGSVAMAVLMPPVIAWPVAYPWDIVLVSVATVLAIILTLRVHDRLFTPMAYMAGVIGIMTCLRLFWNAHHFVSRALLVAIIMAITVISLVIYTFWMRHNARNLKDSAD